MRVDRVVMYRDRNGEWRWRYVRSNGRVMADSGEGYKTKAACRKAAEHVIAPLFHIYSGKTVIGWGPGDLEWEAHADGTEIAEVDRSFYLPGVEPVTRKR